MKKAILYIYDRNKKDLSRQIEDLKAYCSNHNYSISHTIEEREINPHKSRMSLKLLMKNRPGLKELFDFCSEFVVDYVIISELGLLGKISEVNSIVEKLNGLKVGLISVKEDLKTLNEDMTINSDAEFALGIMASFSSNEIKNMESGLLKSVRSGKASSGHSQAYGYKKDLETNELIIDDESSEIVKQIFDLYAYQGKSTQKIADHFNKEGIKTARATHWNKQSIQFILHNPLYIGKGRFEKGTINSPVLIEPELFEKVQVMMNEKQLRTGIKNTFNLLFPCGTIKCGVCGKTFVALYRNNGANYRYSCLSKTGGFESCANVGIDVSRFEKNVQLFLIEHLFHLLIENGSQEFVLKKQLDEVSDKIMRLNKELKKVAKSEKDEVNLNSKSPISLPIMNDWAENIKTEQSRIKKLIDLEISKKNDLLRLANNENVIKENFTKNGIPQDLLLKIIDKITITYEPEVHLMKDSKDRTIRVDIHIWKFIGSFYMSQRSRVQQVNYIDEGLKHMDLKMKFIHFKHDQLTGEMIYLDN